MGKQTLKMGKALTVDLLTHWKREKLKMFTLKCELEVMNLIYSHSYFQEVVALTPAEDPKDLRLKPEDTAKTDLNLTYLLAETIEGSLDKQQCFGLLRIPSRD